MCLFVGREFPGSHRKLYTPSYTFIGFYRWTHMYNKKYRGFHPTGYLSLLAITRHIFSSSCIQLCDAVGCCPTVSSPPNQTPNAMLSITMHSHPFHAMFLYICNAMCHFMPIPCHIYDECYMDNSTPAYHPCIWTIISINIKFPNDHTFHVNIFAYTYQHQQVITNQAMTYFIL